MGPGIRHRVAQAWTSRMKSGPSACPSFSNHIVVRGLRFVALVGSLFPRVPEL